ncbi:MAG: glycosyltransferase family 2 protein [Bacteroidales bacterium]|nr:glycosyltransferase family 2 protein [Bacteroidales bacterium]
MKCSIIIPVYFNEGTIYKTYKLVSEELETNTFVNSFEFIFIDDGSKDGSLEELLKVKSERSEVKIIKFTRNFGQVPAIYAGYKYATGDFVITMSADLQDPPELISDMIYEFGNKAAEIIVCSRNEREESLFRKVTSGIFYKAMKKLSFPNMPKGGFDFVLISKNVLEILNGQNESKLFGRVKFYGVDTL